MNFLGQSFQKLEHHIQIYTLKDAIERITAPRLRVVLKYKMRMKMDVLELDYGHLIGTINTSVSNIKKQQRRAVSE